MSRVEPLPDAAQVPYFGHAAELDQLRSRIMSVTKADSPCLFVGGERGVGKTRLLAEVRTHTDDELVWLEGHCRPVRHGAAPLSALREIAGRLWLDHDALLRRLAPELWMPLHRLMLGIEDLDQDTTPKIVSREDPHKWLCDALAQLLLVLAARTPVALVIEDVHWADLATRDFITYVQARRIPRTATVLTCRTNSPASKDEHDGLVSWLAELRPRCRWWHELQGLSFDDAAALVRHHNLGPLSAGHVAEAYRLSRGNPMLIELLAHSGHESPGGVALVAAGLVAGLPEPARRLVAIIAALGRPCPGAVLAGLTGASLEQVGEWVDAGIRHGVLTECDDGYDFRHPAVGESVYASLPEVDRHRLLCDVTSVPVPRTPPSPQTTRVRSGHATVTALFGGETVPQRRFLAIAGLPALAGDNAATAHATEHPAAFDDALEPADTRTGLAVTLATAADYGAAVALWDSTIPPGGAAHWMAGVRPAEAALRVLALTCVGRYQDAAHVAAQAQLDAVPNRTRSPVLIAAVFLAIRRGETGRATRLLDKAATLIDGNTATHPEAEFLPVLRCELALTAGTPRDAALRASLGTLWQAVTCGLSPAADIGALVVLARAGGDGVLPEGTAGEAPSVSAVRASVEKWRRVNTTPGWSAAIDTANAELGRRNDAAPDVWASLYQRWASLHRPYEAAYALWREAEACLRLRPGQDDRARDRLRRSHLLAERIGAQRLAAVIDAASRRAHLPGLRDMPATDSQRRQDRLLDALNRYGLTRREQDVVHLVAAGRSNREIATELSITPGTAAIHVSRILAKLGVSSRAQAAALVHELKS